MKSISKILMYVVFSLFMIFTIRIWLDGFEKPKEDVSVMSKLIELQGKSSEHIEDLLGKTNEIHREKIYTYKDDIAQYDILVDGNVKSVVITMDKRMSEQQIFIELGIKEDIDDKEITNMSDKMKVVIYDVGGFSRIEMNDSKGNDGVEKIKIEY